MSDQQRERVPDALSAVALLSDKEEYTMTHTVDSSTDLVELHAQKKSAKDAYKEQKRLLKVQIRSLKHEAKRAKKIAKLENRLGHLRQSAETE